MYDVTRPVDLSASMCIKPESQGRRGGGGLLCHYPGARYWARMLRATAQRLPLAAAITQTISIPCHRYGARRLVTAETANITKDDDVAIACIPMFF